MVNSGQCREAIALLDLLLTNHPGNMGALAARGTAKALLGQLQGTPRALGARPALSEWHALVRLAPVAHAALHMRRRDASLGGPLGCRLRRS